MWLIGLIGIVLVLLGAVIGLAIVTWMQSSSLRTVGHTQGPVRSLGDQLVDAQAGAYFGIAVATAIWLILWATAVGAGDRILLASAKAREIQREDAPQLWNVVEEMTIASGLSKMPRIFIIDDAALNAFAVGYRPEKAAVAVTAGLLKRLTRDELQGVIAHELGHIRNQDVRFMTLAGVMVGAIVLISQVFLRGLFYGSVGRRRSSRGGGGGGYAALIMLAVAILVAVLAPLAAQLLYFACSRRRELLADASAARYTRYPPGLASALEKIAGRAGGGEAFNKVVAPMCIVNPLQGRAAFSLFATHPRIDERIRILRNMAGAGFAAYEEAFRRLHGEQTHCLGERTLAGSEEAAIREATSEPKTRQSAIERAQAVGTVLDHILPLVVLGCPCGVRLKLPPDFKRATVKCPRCGREHAVPRAAAKAGAVADRRGAPAEPLWYRRKGIGWETFQCACGHPIQLSPKFSAGHIDCPKCKARIEVVAAGG